MRTALTPILLALGLLVPALSGLTATTDAMELGTAAEPGSEGLEPHVIVAIPDSGINPYHNVYYRPDRTDHPCTYIDDFPCWVEELPLSVGQYTDWDTAFQADQALWDSVQIGKWYWIPKTVFVAVECESHFSSATSGTSTVCILDDASPHGTGTTSSVIMENPDALIAFKEGGAGITSFQQAGIPVDIYSVSWGHIVPIPTPGICLGRSVGPLVFKAAGNEPGVSTLADCWSGNPELISVGGAYANGRSQEVLAYKEPDIVSYYCRPTADTNTIYGMRSSYCGTSFAAPTAAGALSKVVLGLRRASGDTGSGVRGDYVDPVAGVTVRDLRDAMNLTASYTPTNRYSNSGTLALALNPLAPWLQWGWGFYDTDTAAVTLEYLLGNIEAPRRSPLAAIHQETIYEARKTLYG